MRLGDTFIKAVSSFKLMIYRIIVKENILYQAPLLYFLVRRYTPNGRLTPLDLEYNICTHEEKLCFNQYNNNHNFYRDFDVLFRSLFEQSMFFKHVLVLNVNRVASFAS